MRTDINTFVGSYPFRNVPGTTIASLVQQLALVGVTDAWVSDLSAIFWHDPSAGNAMLVETCAGVPGMRPVPAIHPAMPGWEQELDRALDSGAPCVRCDPTFYGIAPDGTDVRALVAACAERSVPLMMAVRLEDVRQRHPNDGAPDLQPWAVRALVRSHPRARLIITHADREFIEQVHFGSTPEESGRLLWDICWIWGPPEDHLALLLETVGIERFAFGTGAPLRIADNSAVKVELLDLDPGRASLLDHANAAGFIRR